MVVKLSINTKYWMALSSVSGIGPKTVRMLISRFGSLEKALAAPVAEIAQMPRMNLQLAREIARVERRLSGFEKLIDQMSRERIDVLCPDSSEYPLRLKSIESFPPILYKMGARLPEDVLTVAIVGTRSPTPSSADAAEKMARRLVAMGVVVISGLAVGVDTAAHRGALEAGGRTFAVLGSGLKMVYPYENLQLANEICVNGAILSECHPNEVVSVQRLMQRNRIISGLSSGVILVEPRKGALNTAERAARQSRHIFIYDPVNDIVLPSSLSKTASSMHGIDELDALVDRLRTVEKEERQMNLL